VAFTQCSDFLVVKRVRLYKEQRTQQFIATAVPSLRIEPLLLVSKYKGNIIRVLAFHASITRFDITYWDSIYSVSIVTWLQTGLHNWGLILTNTPPSSSGAHHASYSMGAW